MLGTNEELGRVALVKYVFICSRQQSFVVSLCLMFHFTKNHTRLGHPVSCLCHRPISLTYKKYEQNSEVSNHVVYSSLGYHCFKTN